MMIIAQLSADLGVVRFRVWLFVERENLGRESCHLLVIFVTYLTLSWDFHVTFLEYPKQLTGYSDVP
jgi:hypothetical protein